MILLIGFIALIVSIVALAFWYRAPERRDVSQPVAGISGAIAILVIGAWIICALIAPGALADNQDTYTELMIYKQTVEQSTNEYVRWNYYDKVCEWNERYESAVNQPESFWFAPYQFDVFEGTTLIDFQLHGDEMPEG